MYATFFGENDGDPSPRTVGKLALRGCVCYQPYSGEKFYIKPFVTERKTPELGSVDVVDAFPPNQGLSNTSQAAPVKTRGDFIFVDT